MIECLTFLAVDPMRRISITLLLFTLVLLLSGCGMIVERQASKAAQSLSDALLNQEDPEMVASAMPTFLIVVDSIAADPDASTSTLLSAAQMYGAYAGAFVSDERRKKILSLRALDYIRRGSCASEKKWCELEQLNREAFADWMKKLEKEDVAVAYAYATSWLGYIQANSEDWNNVANLTKAKELLLFVAAENEGYDHAGAHLYLGAIESTLPPAMGGKPEEGKKHFDRALELTGGRHLLVKVEYARRYARMVFDKELHHQLLTEVVETSPKEPGLTLTNSWSQQEARKLLDDESAYFD